VAARLVKFGTRITRTRFDIETPFLEKTPVVALPAPRLASESQPALTAIFFSALCASALLTGLLTAHGRFTAIGDVHGGWFFLPPWSCWKKWARNAITSGIRELGQEGADIQLLRVG